MQLPTSVARSISPIAFRIEGLEFNSGVGRIEHSIANGSPPRHFVDRSYDAQAQ